MRTFSDGAWKLSSYHIDVVYRPGKNDAVADTFSRIHTSLNGFPNPLSQLQTRLCHPGVTRIYQRKQCKNSPFEIIKPRK